VVEDLGNFKKLLDPGFHCIPFPLSQVAGTLSLRIQQLDVTCETKTKDNVFVRVEVAVQYRVITVSTMRGVGRVALVRERGSHTLVSSLLCCLFSNSNSSSLLLGISIRCLLPSIRPKRTDSVLRIRRCKIYRT